MISRYKNNMLLIKLKNELIKKMKLANNILNNKTVLVTGGTGSFNAFVKRTLEQSNQKN